MVVTNGGAVEVVKFFTAIHRQPITIRLGSVVVRRAGSQPAQAHRSPGQGSRLISGRVSIQPWFVPHSKDTVTLPAVPSDVRSPFSGRRGRDIGGIVGGHRRRYGRRREVLLTAIHWLPITIRLGSVVVRSARSQPAQVSREVPGRRFSPDQRSCEYTTPRSVPHSNETVTLPAVPSDVRSPFRVADGSRDTGGIVGGHRRRYGRTS